MIEVLTLIFSDLWHFVGAVVLIWSIGCSAALVAAAVRG